MTATHRQDELQFGNRDEATGPWFAEVRPCPAPELAFAALAHRPHCLFLDSASSIERLGQHSFLMSDPIEWHWVDLDQQQPLGRLRETLRQWHASSLSGLPPFQGGLAGLWAYDLNRSYERINAPRFRDLETPALAVGLYDTVIAWDHQQGRCWIVSHGLEEAHECDRRGRALDRIREVNDRIKTHPQSSSNLQSLLPGPTSIDQLAPQYLMDDEQQLYSSFSREGFLEAVSQGIEYIRAGDIFQVNLAHRLLTPARCHAVELYHAVRQQNPAPFAAYFDLGTTQIVSASPERLVQLNAGKVESRPIKGTTQRTQFPEADLAAAESLRHSEKDRAENVMIVDLLRNDLSKVCRPDSICVTQLCDIEQYQFVQHLVSAIQGQLKESADALDLVEAIFPGGSITGAPKIRAMEIIAELEPTPRGAYCGSLGYIGLDGTCDLNILIRTLTAQEGWWSFPVGGGIVVQSSPEKELAETWHKARGMLRGIQAVASRR